MKIVERKIYEVTLPSTHLAQGGVGLWLAYYATLIKEGKIVSGKSGGGGCADKFSCSVFLFLFSQFSFISTPTDTDVLLSCCMQWFISQGAWVVEFFSPSNSFWILNYFSRLIRSTAQRMIHHSRSTIFCKSLTFPGHGLCPLTCEKTPKRLLPFVSHFNFANHPPVSLNKRDRRRGWKWII